MPMVTGGARYEQNAEVNFSTADAAARRSPGTKGRFPAAGHVRALPAGATAAPAPGGTA